MTDIISSPPRRNPSGGTATGKAATGASTTTSRPRSTGSCAQASSPTRKPRSWPRTRAVWTPRISPARSTVSSSASHGSQRTRPANSKPRNSQNNQTPQPGSSPLGRERNAPARVRVTRALLDESPETFPGHIYMRFLAWWSESPRSVAFDALEGRRS